MFIVYRWAGTEWVTERKGFNGYAAACRHARALETRGTAVRTIVRRERAA